MGGSAMTMLLSDEGESVSASPSASTPEEALATALSLTGEVPLTLAEGLATEESVSSSSMTMLSSLSLERSSSFEEG